MPYSDKDWERHGEGRGKIASGPQPRGVNLTRKEFRKKMGEEGKESVG